MRWIFLPALLLAALAGCAGMGADECRTADWHAIGYEDGARGQAPEFFGERRKDCAEHGITADFAAYRAGRSEGLAHYCRPHNGYQLGTRGSRYAGICPAELEGPFLVAYDEGYGLYEREATLRNLNKRLHHSRERADKVEHLLAEHTTRLLSPELPAGEVAATAVEIKQLTQERVELERRISELEQEEAAAEYELERYRSRLASW